MEKMLRPAPARNLELYQRRPTLYKFSDLGGNDMGVSGGITAMWNYSPSLKFMFGVMFSPDSDLKLLPMAGLDWAINDRLELRLMFPKPGLIYRPNDHWSFHAGADLNMATFRTSDSLGTSIGLPQYNDALGTYRDICIGAGVGNSSRQSKLKEIVSKLDRLMTDWL